jgi:5-carboxymethyl-2-hydroxymuconate isomerase
MDAAMPHCRLEYSGNLERVVDIGELCRLVADTMVASALFEVGGIRVRAFRTDHHVIADGHPDNRFIDMILRIGAGRSAEAKKEFGDQLFQKVADHLGALFDQPHFALSFEIQEIDSGLSWKKNSMHARLRGSEE